LNSKLAEIKSSVKRYFFDIFLPPALIFYPGENRMGDGTLSGYSEAAPKMRSRGPTPPFSPSLTPRQLFPIRKQQHGSIVFLIEHAGGKEIFN
jgi:hypothetical protein